MAVTTPAAPTADSICLEGLKAAGIGSPTNNQLERARSETLPYILAELMQRRHAWGSTRLKSLEKAAAILLETGRRRYDLPTDCDEEVVLTLFKPDATFTVLATELDGSMEIRTNDDVDTELVGRYIFVSPSDQESDVQMREVVAMTVAGGTTTIRVDDAWSKNSYPQAGVTAYIMDGGSELLEIDEVELDHTQYTGGTGVPYYFVKHRDVLEFDVSADGPYGVMLRYFSNLNDLPWADEPMPTIFKRWRAVLISGIQSKILLEKGDLDAYKFAKQDYEQQVEMLMRAEISYGGSTVALVPRQGGYV